MNGQNIPLVKFTAPSIRRVGAVCGIHVLPS